MSGSPELAQFISVAAQAHPSLRGEIAFPGAGCIVAERDNHRLLGELYGFWQQAFPEAGRPYWAIRSWTLIVWQPVFLAVIGVHGLGRLPSLTTLGQKADGGMVAGFCLPEAPLRQGPEAELIALAGDELRSLAEMLLAQLSTLTRVRRVSALRLVADMLLSAIMGLGRLKPELGNAELRALAGRWLDATGLPGQSDLMPIVLDDGREQLALNRKACCMHYLRDDGELCASCPKQKMPVRVQRLQQELSGRA